MPTTSTLSLGTRKDAIYWSDECASQLSYTKGATLTKPSPSMNEMETLFGRSDEWLFFGGHFTEQDHLYNENGSVSVRFASDQVTLKTPAGTKSLKKGDGFKQHAKVKAIFWGGCNVHSYPAIVKDLRALFGNPLMIGWTSVTGWQILHIVMGGAGNAHPNPAQDFFDRVKANPSSETQVKDAWLGAGAATFWGNAKPDFSVIDSSGNEHGLPERAEDLTS